MLYTGEPYFQVLSTVEVLEHPLGTAYWRLAPDSYVTAPLLSTLMNLYSKLVPAGRSIFVVHNGLEEVYWLADSAGAFAVFQLPSWAIDPTILTVWPNDVVVLELNVTDTVDTAAAQPEGVAAGAEVEVEIEVEVGFAEDVGALLEVGGDEPDPPPPDPPPLILISAHVRYTCGV